MMADLTCPNCSNQAFTDYGDGLVACQHCYTQFDLNQQQCLYCGSLLAEGTVVCVKCGTDLRGEGARRTIRERLMTTNDWRRVRLSQVQKVKAKSEETSRQRLKAWWDEDRKRIEAERQEKMARQRRRRNVLIIWAIIVVLVVLLIALVVLLVYFALPSAPTAAAWMIQSAAG